MSAKIEIALDRQNTDGDLALVHLPVTRTCDVQAETISDRISRIEMVPIAGLILRAILGIGDADAVLADTVTQRARGLDHPDRGPLLPVPNDLVTT